MKLKKTGKRLLSLLCSMMIVVSSIIGTAATASAAPASNIPDTMLNSKDLQIFVCGVSPFEFAETTQLLSLPGSGSRYIYSFVSDADQPGILELMEDRADETIFAPWTPDPFVYLSSSNAMYRKILSAEPVTKEKKHGLFRRKER